MLQSFLDFRTVDGACDLQYLPPRGVVRTKYDYKAVGTACVSIATIRLWWFLSLFSSLSTLSVSSSSAKLTLCESLQSQLHNELTISFCSEGVWHVVSVLC